MGGGKRWSGCHMLIKAFLAILLVATIFSMGFHLGTIVGSVEGGYGHSRHMMYGGDWGEGMMYAVPDATAPAAPATTSITK